MPSSLSCSASCSGRCCVCQVGGQYWSDKPILRSLISPSPHPFKVDNSANRTVLGWGLVGFPNLAHVLHQDYRIIALDKELLSQLFII